MSEASALSRRAREEAAHRAQRAKDWAARATAAERAPEAIACPPGATERQRATWGAAMGELIMRERQSKIARGWTLIPKRTAPPGCIALAALNGARMVVLCIDLRGALRLSEGGRAGPIVTVAEAARLAAGR